MKKPKLSVALVTRNEEERLRACLESVAWADEIVVVDAESDDKTATITRAVHESVSVDGRVERLTGHLEHRSYRDIGDFLARADRYATLAADEAVAQGRRVGVSALVLRPLGRFLGMYVAGRGFLDGWRG